jgi:hypothetical protein
MDITDVNASIEPISQSEDLFAQTFTTTMCSYRPMSRLFSSPHAEMMRKRNNIIFNLVESEREYVHQLEILVANYVRPFRMGN